MRLSFPRAWELHASPQRLLGCNEKRIATYGGQVAAHVEERRSAGRVVGFDLLRRRGQGVAQSLPTARVQLVRGQLRPEVMQPLK